MESFEFHVVPTNNIRSNKVHGICMWKETMNTEGGTGRV